MSYALARRLLFALPAERAHDAALGLLHAGHRLGLAERLAARVPGDPCEVFGLSFANRVGLAAGLDKNADHVDALGALGFGSIEVGTVTPRPQPGNPPPRLFRLPAHEALINRMGFNNRGVDHAVARLERRRYRGVVGVNIGKNRDTPVADALDDYLACLDRVHAVADYVTVNVSSPNTPGLRTLQSGPALDRLLGGLAERRARLAGGAERPVPMLVKIAPDMDAEGLAAIADAVLEHGLDGIIATNTTSARDAVAGARHADEEGGLSGRPLLEPSNRALETLHAAVGDRVPLIGVGGIVDGNGARAKRAAGASLVQLYTGLIYRGPGLIATVAKALRDGAG